MDYKWSLKPGVLFNQENQPYLIRFVGTQKEWSQQTLFSTIYTAFLELDNNNFSKRYIITSRRNCKLIEQFDDCMLQYERIDLFNETFTKIGLIRYVDIEVLFDRTTRDDTIFCISQQVDKKLTSEIRVVE